MCTADFNVNLVYQPTLSFSSFKLETPVQKDLKNANLKVQANFYNPDDTRQATVHLTLKDPNGKKVAEQTVTDVLPLGEVRLLLSKARYFGARSSLSYTPASSLSKLLKVNKP